MSDNPNRRKDDARPAVSLQWGDRPDHWTLLLTGPTAGVIGPLGSTWPNHPAELERVDVCVRRPGKPVGVFRTGGEGTATWHQFYPLVDADVPALRDGEYLFREGATLKPEFTHPMMLAAERAGVSFSAQQKCWRAWFDTREPRKPPTLDSIELYRIQMAGISAASLGHWKLGDSIHPDYDTVPLRDVARLYAKYEALFKAQPSDAARDVLTERRRQVEQEGYDHEHDDAHPGGEIAAYAAFYAMPPAAREWPATETGYGDTFGEAIVPADWKVPKEGDRRSELVKAGALILAEIERLDRAATAAPDAVDAALADAIQHGTGAFQVKADGSTEHVELSKEDQRHYAELAAFPPKLQRDALYQDYAVPKQEGDPA